MQTKGFHGKLALVHYDDVVPFCTRLLEPNSFTVGNKIKTKLKFGINYIGKKQTKTAVENIMID